MDIDKIQKLDLETSLAIAEQMATQKQGGHLTVFRFTTHWKCAFGTPCLDGPEGRGEVLQLKAFPTLKEALLHLIVEEQTIGGP